jgi:ectoine hydroxylase-related dioxygenase (phytanoyl-CoA dioxygenase family)
VTEAGPANGGLEVVSGSHDTLPPVHVSNGERFPRTATEHVRDIQGEPVDLKAGQAFLFSGRLLHRSKPNLSGKIRVGLQFNLAPEHVRIEPDYPYPGHRVWELDRRERGLIGTRD